MTSKFSVSFCNSPGFEMPEVRMKLDGKFSEGEGKSDNMSVFARIRPMLQREKDAGYKECVAAIDDKVVRAVVPKSSYKFKNSNNAGQEIIEDFTYSQAFGPETGQFMFFEQTIMNTMESFIAGQNCLVFSYGITNSGKTYTLQGNDENPGIIILALKLFFASIEHQLSDYVYLKPDRFSDYIRLSESDRFHESRIKEDLFKTYNQLIANKSGDSSANLTKSFAMTLCECFSDNFKMKDTETTLAQEEMEAAQSALLMKNISKEVANQQWGKCNVWISFIEIYNEYIYDLFNSDVHQRKTLQLAEDKNGDVYVKGAKEVCVSDVDEALKLLHLGRRNLKIACTKLNYQSSRSHCIYIIKVVRFDKNVPEVRVNRLAFCDLAGSERASKSEASGMRLKEASYINTSLLVLGRCLEQLRLNQNLKDKKLIPFRESKLTRFFSNHFMGKGKAVMIANASPCEYTFDETLNVLRFSALAKELLLNDSYISMASSSLQNINEQWTKSRARVSTSFSLDQSSDMDSSLLEDLQAKDEMIEKLLDLADSLRSNLENEKKQKTQLEYTIRQDVCKEYSEYSDELLARQKSAHEEQMRELKMIYDKQLHDIEKLKNDRIKELKEQLEEYASSDDSFNKSEIRKSDSSFVENSLLVKKDEKEDADLITFDEETSEKIPIEPDSLHSQLEKYEEENKVLKLDLCSLKNQLEISAIEVQNSMTKIINLENEMQKFKDQAATLKTESDNLTVTKCDHLGEIEKLTSDLVSLREDLEIITSERDTIQEQLEQTSSLLKDSQTNESATQDKCIDLNSKLQEALQVLEQYEKEKELLKSTVSDTENKLTEERSAKQKLEETIFTLSGELKKLKTDTEKDDLAKSLENTINELNKQKNKIEEIEKEKALAETNYAELLEKNTTLEETVNNLKNSLNESESKTSELSCKLEELNHIVEEHKSKVFALESECEVYRNESAKLFADSKILEEKIEITSQNLETMKKERDAIKKTGDNVINCLKSDLTETEKKCEELKISLDKTNDIIKEHESVCNALKEENESLKENNEILTEKLTVKEDEEKSELASEVRCIELDSKLQEVLQVLEQYEKEKEFLKSAVSDTENKLTEERSAKEELQETIFSLSDQLEKMKSDTEKDDLTKSLESITCELNEQRSKIEELEKEKVLAEANVAELLEKNTALDETVNNLKNSLNESESKTSELSCKLEKLNHIVEEHKNKVFALESECGVHRNELEELVEMSKNEKANLLEKENLYNNLKSDHEKLLEEFSSLKNELNNKSEIGDKSYTSENEVDFETDEPNEIESYQQKLAEKEKECELLTAQYDTLSTDHSTLKIEYQTLTEKIEVLTKNVEVLENEKKSAENDLCQLKVDIDKASEDLKRMSEVEDKILEVSHNLEQKNFELSKMQIECTSLQKEIEALEERNKIFEESSLNLSNKLDAAETEAAELKKKLEIMYTQEQESVEKIKTEKDVLENRYKELMENDASLREKIHELSDRNEKAILKIEQLEKQNSDLELSCSANKEENAKLKKSNEEFENSLSSLSEKLAVSTEEISQLKKKNEELTEKFEEYTSQCTELTNLLEAAQKSELKASEKVKALNVSLSSCSDCIKDLERQITEKEANIEALEEAIVQKQELSKEQMKEVKADYEKQIQTLKQQLKIEITESKHLKLIAEKENQSLKAENTMLKRKVDTNAENKKVTKKKSNLSKVRNTDEKENSDASSESFQSEKLKRSFSLTSEEGEQKEGSKKTRRALRTRDGNGRFSYYDSDSDDKSTKSRSRKRKSSGEFVPPKKTQKKTSKSSKIPAKKNPKNDIVLQAKKENADENMSPVQKMAAFVGSTFSHIAQTVSSMPSPRMTRGRRKLFNLETAPTAASNKNWRY